MSSSFCKPIIPWRVADASQIHTSRRSRIQYIPYVGYMYVCRVVSPHSVFSMCMCSKPTHARYARIRNSTGSFDEGKFLSMYLCIYVCKYLIIIIIIINYEIPRRLKLSNIETFSIQKSSKLLTLLPYFLQR